MHMLINLTEIIPTPAGVLAPSYPTQGFSSGFKFTIPFAQNKNNTGGVVFMFAVEICTVLGPQGYLNDSFNTIYSTDIILNSIKFIRDIAGDCPIFHRWA